MIPKKEPIPIQTDISGFYFEFDGDETDAHKEAETFLNRHFKKIFPLEKDPNKSIESEATNETKKKENPLLKLKKEPFSRINAASISNILLFDLPLINHKNIYEICDSIIEEAQTNPSCLYLTRLIPFEISCSCKDGFKQLQPYLSLLISRHVREWNGDSAPTYFVYYKARQNEEMRICRGILLGIIRYLMGLHSRGSYSRTDEPDLTIIILILHKSALLSIVPKFKQRDRLYLPEKKNIDKK